MLASFAYIDPEYRDTLAAGLFVTSRPTRRCMPRSRSQNWLEDGDGEMWPMVTCWCQHSIKWRRFSRRLRRRAHCGPGFPSSADRGPTREFPMRPFESAEPR